MTRNGTRLLGLICVLFAVLCGAVWIPMDTATGLVEQVRRRVEIGDALAPTVAAAFVLIGGLVLVLAPGSEKPDDAPLRAIFGFAAAMLAILVLGFVLMLYAGPLALWLAEAGGDAPREYRLLRNSFPWKYIGFVSGGVLAISGTISLAERRASLHALAIGVLAVLGMIALFDLPFDDLLLPPNGDY